MISYGRLLFVVGVMVVVYLSLESIRTCRQNYYDKLEVGKVYYVYTYSSHVDKMELDAKINGYLVFGRDYLTIDSVVGEVK